MVVIQPNPTQLEVTRVNWSGYTTPELSVLVINLEYRRNHSSGFRLPFLKRLFGHKPYFRSSSIVATSRKNCSITPVTVREAFHALHKAFNVVAAKKFVKETERIVAEHGYGKVGGYEFINHDIVALYFYVDRK